MSGINSCNLIFFPVYRGRLGAEPLKRPYVILDLLLDIRHILIVRRREIDAPNRRNLTAVNGIPRASAIKAPAYYNLYGQRVSEPRQGIYITEGKKIRIK